MQSTRNRRPEYMCTHKRQGDARSEAVQSTNCAFSVRAPLRSILSSGPVSSHLALSGPQP